MFSGMSPIFLAICTFLGTVILSDEVYPWSLKRYITGASIAPSYVFGHITSANIDSQLYKLCETQ